MDGFHNKEVAITVRIWILDKHSGPNVDSAREAAISEVLP